MKTFICTVIILLNSISMSYPHFVAQDGNNSNSGTFDAPWKTLQYAIDNSVQGDSVFMKAGIYQENILIRQSGTPEYPILVKNYQDDSVELRTVGSSHLITLIDCHDIIIKGLRLIGTTTDRGGNSVFCLKNHCSNITIEGCEIHQGNYGIKSDHTSQIHHILILNNSIHDLEDQGIRFIATKSTECQEISIIGNEIYRNGYSKKDNQAEWGAGVYLQCDNSIIESNAIHDNQGNGLFMDCNSDLYHHHNIIRKNHFHHNGFNGVTFAGQHHCLIYENEMNDNGWYFNIDTFTNPLHGIYMMWADYNIIYNNVMYNHSNGSAVRLEGSYNVIRDNIFYNNGNAMYSTDCYEKPVYGNIIRNNLMYGSRQSYDSFFPGSGIEADGTVELHFYNNVLYDLKGFGLAYVDGNTPSTGAKLKNNIFMKTGWESIWIGNGNELNYVEDYNVYFPDKSDLIRMGNEDYNLRDYELQWRQGKHSITEDPMFINPEMNNFHLTRHSPCIDKGDFLTMITQNGEGYSIPVMDALYFCDGHNIISGDLIQLQGKTQTAIILEINHTENILQVDQFLSWSKGQGIGLVYQGMAPDIGAFEYVKSKSPLPDKYHSDSVHYEQLPNFIIEHTSKDGLAMNPSQPFQFELYPNYPNPFSSGKQLHTRVDHKTILAYSIAFDSIVNISIFDIFGRRIKNLVNAYKNIGLYSTDWDGKNESDHFVSSGVYFCLFKFQGGYKIRKIAFIN